MTEAERDKRDLEMHRVIAHAIKTVQMQFGLERDDTLDHFEAYIEAEREEILERKFRAALETECRREVDA